MFPHLYLSLPLSEEAQARKRQRGLCIMYRCQRLAEVGQRRAICLTCHSRRKRLANPVAYAFANLRCSARKRGIGFELTFSEFEEFCARTGYAHRRGKEPESLTVDRINRFLPYRADNIRPMTYEANISHRHDVSEPADF